MGDKFAQLKQFWQKGNKEPAPPSASSSPPHPSSSGHGGAPSTNSVTLATTRAASTQTAAAKQPEASPAAQPAPVTQPQAAAFDPYGAVDELDFVPEPREQPQQEQEGASAAATAFDPYGAVDGLDFVPEQQEREEEEAGPRPSSTDSPYALHEDFLPENKKEEENEEAIYDKTVSPYSMGEDFVAADDEAQQASSSSSSSASASSSLYAAPEDFVDEGEDDGYRVVEGAGAPYHEPPVGLNKPSDLVFTHEPTHKKDQHKMKEKMKKSSSPSLYAAAAASTIDVYGLAADEGEIEAGSGRDEDSRYSVTPYESFDGSSSPYYSGAVDDDIVADKKASASIYGDDEESRPEAAYSAEDMDTLKPERVDKKDASDSDDDYASDSDLSDDEGPDFLQNRANKAKDWNAEFQVLLDMPPCSEKYNKLARLAHDFVFAAETYGKIIISELSLPEDKKTIKPIDVGGQAGGEKYIVQGIFFKFALDIYNIYGSDEYAMKAASHDLKGLIHYYSCQIAGLHVPLMALIDYLGFRLIAITILPINSSTIRYGSCDAGRTIHADDLELNKMMEQAGEKMKLQSHLVGIPGGIPKTLSAPVDIEGHLGTDGRYYVVDFARTFPPERPSPANMGKKGVILYNLLRPELVKSNTEPLSPDAFTLWAKADPNKDLYNKNVTDATKRLIKEVVPIVATKLNALSDSQAHLDLVEILHTSGVNLRHMGYVRRLANKEVQALIMIEMISRVVRKELQEKYRKKTRSAGIPTEEPHKQAAAKYLNKLLGRHHRSEEFWKRMKRSLLRKFHRCLLDYELEESYDLRVGLKVDGLFKRLQKLAPNIFVLTEAARQDFDKAASFLNWGKETIDLKLHPSDMMPLAASVKHMNVIDIAEACASFYSSLDEKGNDQSRLLIQGLGKFQIAARKMPFIEAETIITLGDMLVNRANEAKELQKHDEYDTALRGALIAFQTALNLDPTDSRCLMGLGDVFNAKNERDKAVEMYYKAIQVKPDEAEAHLKIAKIHSRSEDKGDNVNDHLRKALEFRPDCIEAMIMLGDELFTAAVHAHAPDHELIAEESRLLLEEACDLYSKALSLDPNLGQKCCIHSTLRSLDKPSIVPTGHDTKLYMLWQLVEKSGLLRNYCSKLLAQLEELHIEGFRLVDAVFKQVASSAVAARSVYLRRNRKLSEEAIVEWLLSHHASLHELSMEDFPQFTDSLITALTSSIHRQSLRTLVLAGALNLSTSALLQSFKSETDAEAALWPSLTCLDVSGIPSVEDEVVIAISRAAPSLIDLRASKANMTDLALEALPIQLTRLHLGGTISVDAMKSLFTQRCTSLTDVSLRGMEELDVVTAFSLSSAIPCLRKFEFPDGQVHLWSGDQPVQVKLQHAQPAPVFMIDIEPGKLVHYQVRLNMNSTDIHGFGFTNTIMGSPMNKTISQNGSLICRVMVQQQLGWMYHWNLTGTALVRSANLNPHSRSLVCQPADVVTSSRALTSHYSNFTVAPHRNISLACTAMWLALTIK